jgi:pimeloyl-ACP methyl ester carboxylesterase
VPHATNPIDQTRTFFEDQGGDGPPVLVYPGSTDPLEYAKTSPLVRALQGDFRMIFTDHRGQGRSEKPHDVRSYALTTRVADATAILDEAGIERAHYLGFSWGARLGFAIGEHASERVHSLVLCGNQPYEWPMDGPMLRAVSDAVAAGKERGMAALVEVWESSLGDRFPEPARTCAPERPAGAGSRVPVRLPRGPDRSRSLGVDDMPDLRRRGGRDARRRRACGPRDPRGQVRLAARPHPLLGGARGGRPPATRPGPLALHDPVIRQASDPVR